MDKRYIKILSATAILAGASLASRLLGLFRDRVFASTFGAGHELDAYFAAFRIPDFVYTVLISGALFAAFLPVFTECVTNKKECEAWRVANSLINVMILTAIILFPILCLLAPQIVDLVAPGFTGETKEVTVYLTRIMIISPLFFGISGVLGSMLNTFKKFLVFSLSPILYNLGIIIGAVYLVPVFGIKGVAFGVIAGSLLQLLIQIPAAYRLGYRYQPIIDFKNSNLHSIGKLFVPRLVSAGLTQFTFVAQTVIASTLAVGSIAIINFANNLQSLPVGLLGIAFATAIFPNLAEHSSKKDTTSFIADLSFGLRQILFFIIPATAAIILMRAQIVRVVLGSGQFSWQDTALTAKALGFFAISLFAQATVPLILRAFFALKDTKTPLYIGIVTMALNIILALMLGKSMGSPGLALSYSIANGVYMLLLLTFLRHKLGRMDDVKIFVSLLKFSIASLVMAAAIYASLYLIAGVVDMQRSWGITTQAVGAAVIGFIVYLGVSWVIGVKEISILKPRFSKKHAKQD